MDSSLTNSNLSFLHRYHLLLKTHYFLFYSAFGVVFPILNITLRSHGLSNIEISYSNIILPFLVFLTSPLIGFIADKSRRFLLTFNLIYTITIIAFTGLFFLPYIKSYNIQANLHAVEQYEYVLDFCASQEVATKCATRSECGCSYQAYCKKENETFSFAFTMNSNSIQKEFKDNDPSQCGIAYRIPIDKVLLKDELENYQLLMIKCQITCSIPHFCHGLRYGKQMIFILLYSILYIIGSNLLSVANAIGASIGFASLSSPNLFGQQRVWGTIGFGIVAFLTSRIYEFYKSEYVYVVMFLITSISTVLVTSFVPIQKITTTKNHKLDSSALISLLKNTDVIVFLSITFVWGMCFGCLYPYVSLYIDEIAPCQSRSIIGWMTLIAASSEVFAFYFARKMLQFFGTNLSSIIIFLSFAIRFGGYYFIEKPYFLLPIETMHFFNYGILYVLIAQKADSIAPPGLSGTLQGIAHGVTHGLGRGIGLLVSSFIYIVIQQRLLFLVFAILNIIAAIIYSIYFIIKREKPATEIVTISNKDGNKIIDNIPETNVLLNEEPLLSSPTMETNKNNNANE